MAFVSSNQSKEGQKAPSLSLLHPLHVGEGHEIHGVRVIERDEQRDCIKQTQAFFHIRKSVIQSLMRNDNHVGLLVKHKFWLIYLGFQK